MPDIDQAPNLTEANTEQGRWLERLGKAMTKRAIGLKRYQDYYDGEHRLQFATERFRKAFGGLFAEFADNWCDLVVDAVDERLRIEGFRYGKDAAADDDAWQIWQENGLDAESQIGHTEALINGLAYALVWADGDREIDSTGGRPRITIESPLETITATAPGSRRRRLAGLKRWRDPDDGYYYATLYLPDGLYKLRSRSKVRQEDEVAAIPEKADQWERREIDDEPWPLPNPLGRIPLVVLPNRPRLRAAGQSEIHKVIPLQDAINKLVADMIVASEYAAVRQRWVAGLDIPVDPETGEEIEPFKTADRLWITEDGEVKFGEFEASDLGNYVKAIEMAIQHVASQTRTPPHYFYLRGEFPSGESIKSAETGLVAKARRKMLHLGEAWEDTMRLAFLVLEDRERARRADVETIWGDPESRTEAEHVDATTKKAKLGVPTEQIWEDLGYSPTQIARFKQMQSEEALLVADAFDRVDPTGNGRPTLPGEGERENAGAG